MQDMDAQFSLDMVTDLDAIFARRQAAADAAIRTFSPLRGIPYGTGPAERLNIFAPQGETLAPVMIFIHGGFWKSLDADLFSFLASGFVPQGVMLVVIDYPLMPVARLDQVVAACAKSVTWVAGNIATYGGDPNRIHISGNSAGGHLVAELAAEPALTDIVQSFTAISGIFDLEPVTRSFQNDDLQLTEDEIARFSPGRRDLAINIPALVIVGSDETEEFKRQSRNFARKIGTEPMIVEGANHITILLDALADHRSAMNRAVRHLIEQAPDP